MRRLAIVALLCPTLSAQELTNEREFFESGEEHGSLAFTPDGKMLLTAGSFSPIKVRDVESGKTVATFSESAFIFTMQVSPDGKTLATLIDDDANRLIRLRELPSGMISADLNAPAQALAFTPDSATLISSDNVQGIWLWDLDSRKRTSTLSGKGHTIAISSDGKLLACSGDERIEIWDLEAEEVIHRIKAAGSCALAFRPGGNRLAYCSGAEIRIHDLVAHVDTQKLRDDDDDDRFESITFHPDGNWIASSRLNGGVELWETESGKPVDYKRCGPCGIVAFGPTGHVLAYINGIQDYSQSVYLWDVREGTNGR